MFSWNSQFNCSLFLIGKITQFDWSLPVSQNFRDVTTHNLWIFKLFIVSFVKWQRPEAKSLPTGISLLSTKEVPILISFHKISYLISWTYQSCQRELRLFSSLDFNCIFILKFDLSKGITVFTWCSLPASYLYSKWQW